MPEALKSEELCLAAMADTPDAKDWVPKPLQTKEFLAKVQELRKA